MVQIVLPPSTPEESILKKLSFIRVKLLLWKDHSYKNHKEIRNLALRVIVKEIFQYTDNSNEELGKGQIFPKKKYSYCIFSIVNQSETLNFIIVKVKTKK